MNKLLICYAFIAFLLNCKSINFGTREETKYMWNLIKFDFNITKERSYGGISVSTLLGEQPLYVSIAVISGRIRKVIKIIWSILNGIVIPTHIFLFISKDPFMMDKGIREAEIPLELQYLAASTDIFSIVYTDNIGPHRKLLPILQHYWKEDCVIVTFDDDRLVAKDSLFKLINHYVDSNKESVVGLRTRRLGLCASNINSSKNNDISINKSIHNSNDISTKKNKKKNDIRNIKNENSLISTIRRTLSTTNPKSKKKYLKMILGKFKFQLINYDFCLWPRIQNSKKEFLVLPTGNGGILYRPKFFHKIVFDPILRGLTLYNDDLTFRLSTMANKVYVVNGCCEKLESCSNKTMGTNNMKITPPQDQFTNLKKQLLLSKNYPKISNKRTDEMNGSSLYSKNLYWNTDMWLSGIAYLKKKKIVDMSEFYDVNFLLQDRPECFNSQKIMDKRQCGMFSSCSFPT